MTGSDSLSLREAAEALGMGCSTLRRHVHAGRLRAGYVAGPFGRELRVERAALRAFATARQSAGFALSPAPRPVDDVSLGELLRWAEAPTVRVAFLVWARTASTVTLATALRWAREKLSAGTEPPARGSVGVRTGM